MPGTKRNYFLNRQALLLPQAPLTNSPGPRFNWFEGFEHGRLAAGTTEQQHIAAGGSIDTAQQHSGNNSFKFVNATEYIGWPITTRFLSVGFYFRLNTLPSAGSMLALSTVGLAANFQVQVQSIGVLRAGFTSFQNYSGSFAVNTDYWIAAFMRSDQTTFTMDWWVSTGGGSLVPQTQFTATGQTPADMTNVRFGNNSANACIGWVDDLCVSLESEDSPIQEHSSKILVPDSIGTHNLGSGAFQKTSGALDGTEYLDIQAVPPATASWVAQTAIDTNAYLEFGFGNHQSGQLPVAVSFLAFFQGSAANAYTFEVRVNDAGTISSDITATTLAKTGVTYRNGTTVFSVSPGVDPWDEGDIDTVAVRFGFSSDATPNPQLFAVYAIYIYKTPVGVPYADSDTVLMSLTPSGTDAYQGTPREKPMIIVQSTKRMVNF